MKKEKKKVIERGEKKDSLFIVAVTPLISFVTKIYQLRSTNEVEALLYVLDKKYNYSRKRFQSMDQSVEHINYVCSILENPLTVACVKALGVNNEQ
jgi:hypothetical protein